MTGRNWDDLTPEERLLAEQTVLSFRELTKAGHAAADGTVLNVCEKLAVAQGRELTRRMLEATLQEQAQTVEKSRRAASAPNQRRRPGRAPVE